MSQSTLPESLESFTIAKMLPGDTAYTLPWAMWADENRALWINGNYPIRERPGGTVQLFIKRTETGVTVDMSTIGDHTYDPGPCPFVGGNRATHLPVKLVKIMPRRWLGS